MLNGMIRAGRLYEFVKKLVEAHNEEMKRQGEEQKDQILWEIWLHRVFDKSYPDFVEGLEAGSQEALTDEQKADIVAQSKNMLEGFCL